MSFVYHMDDDALEVNSFSCTRFSFPPPPPPVLEERAWDRGYYSTSLVPRPFPPPVFHRFQYEIRRGKAWEIWSRAMPPSRHMVAHGGRCPTKNLDALCCTVRPMAGYQSVRKADDRYRSLFTTPGTDQRETGILTPPVCLPSVYLTSSHVTRSSPAVFHTGSNEILAVGMAWE